MYIKYNYFIRQSSGGMLRFVFVYDAHFAEVQAKNTVSWIAYLQNFKYSRWRKVAQGPWVKAFNRISDSII